MQGAVLLVFPATSYRPAAFVTAAEIAALPLHLCTDLAAAGRRFGLPLLECSLADPAAAATRIVEAWNGDLCGVVAVDEASALVAAHVAQRLGIAFHSIAGVEAARDKRLMRKQLQAAGVAVPEFALLPPDAADAPGRSPLGYPCVLKPPMLSGSQGVLRCDDDPQWQAALATVRNIVDRHSSSLHRTAGFSQLLVERYIDGAEVALEAIMTHGQLHQLAIFDKPDPLVGPTFEETLYVTPSRHPQAMQQRIRATATAAAQSLGLQHGPLHVELRLAASGPVVLEVAARSIGGLCARALRHQVGSLEMRLLHNALDQAAPALPTTPPASGVMMIPVPRSGVLRAVDGVERARQLAGVDAVNIAVDVGQAVRTLPHGSSYLGFIFAHAAQPEQVEVILRKAHAALHFELKPLLQTL